MTTGFRSPYVYFRDEMDAIPFEGPGWEVWKKDEIRKKKFFLFQFMIWTYLFIATTILVFPFWAVIGVDLVMGAPLLAGGIALIMIGAYKRTVINLQFKSK